MLMLLKLTAGDSFQRKFWTGATISGVLALVLCWACWAMLKSGYRLRS